MESQWTSKHFTSFVCCSLFCQERAVAKQCTVRQEKTYTYICGSHTEGLSLIFNGGAKICL
uniref:Uncharacterized protein n=2 Tax=Anguilla anguilla TaxID=7936 RepID=A0A0E9S8Z1_ANGAN